MNSHRDNVKDKLREWLDPKEEGDLDLMTAESATVADILFDTIGISPDEQDMCGGYFMLHGGVKADDVEARKEMETETEVDEEYPSEHDEQLSIVIMTLEHWKEAGYLTIEEEKVKEMKQFLCDIKDGKGYRP